MKKEALIKVLLIEDDPMVQEVNRQLIEKVEGFHVVEIASDGKEGVEIAKKANPDLVLLDIYMPEQDGIKTLKDFRRLELDIDVIIVSAADDTETIREAIHHGAIDYIIKPFKFERLVLALSKYKGFRRQFSEKEKAAQHEIDTWITQKPKESSNNQILPKGLNQQTLAQVIEFLSNQDSAVSADETAEHIGIARVTARRYLDYLGKIERVEIQLQYGVVGRPINRYQLM
ncbi:response regulator [Virgibacillus ndiopensis]|uniref:response regulator n=1 Tax=Virgibacillus ndiopensis TaxID=2004408 RepID=UPI000C07C755|nr:response regulator [Virgibacillus ndiopensis]